MKRQKIILPGIFSILLLTFFVIYRKDNMLQIGAAFFALIWLVQLPGSLILLLAENKSDNILRTVLFGNVIGLALVPLLYYSLYYFNLHQSFDIIISVLNIALGLILIIRLKKKQIQFPSIDKSQLAWIMWLLLIVVVVCSIREFSQMLSWNFVFNSKRDTDAGILMSMVVGIKDYGYLVNMNYGSVPVNYHHFIYLLMALVMKVSHVGILPLYQVVFPLYTFFFMALAAFYLVKSLNTTDGIAFFSAVALLFLDDFYLLNQAIKFLIKQQPFFTIESIEWLHNSPSTAISLLMLFVVIAELFSAEREKIRNAAFILLLFSIGTLACYKISTWACLCAGMMAASVLTFRKNSKLVLLTALSVIAGFAVNKYLSGIGNPIYSSEGMEISIAYPLLRSEAVKKILHFGSDVFSFHDFDLKAAAILFLLMVYYLFGVFGIRLWYVFRKLKEGILKINFASATVLFLAVSGIVISFLVIPKVGRHNSLYFILTGMYLLSVMSMPMVIEHYHTSQRFILKAIVAGILVIQLGSGLLQVVQPFTNPVKAATLSPDWFNAMDYLKNNTPRNSLLAYNRFRLKEDYYKDDFDFVPVFAERPVVVGGKQYFPDYEMRKSKTDSLFSSSEQVKNISDELKIDYIVFDKWNGGKFECNDSGLVQQVYTNQQVDIYKVKKQY